MYRFFQRHGKKLMAVFSAALMIGFALPTFRTGGGGVGAGGHLIGTAGKDKIYQQDVYRARQAWEMLAHTPGEQGRAIVEILPAAALTQIQRRPILFLLLQKEAQRMGMTVNVDDLGRVIENYPSFKTGDPAHDEDLKNSLAQLMLVRQAFVRAASAIKISDPMRDHELGQLGQSITLNAADFTTGQYTAKVPAPTAEQLKAQFDKFADMIKGTPYGENPFGFGYRYPDRIKLQYIAISRAAVRKFVEEFNSPGHAKDQYEWEVEAQKYYRQHQSEFPTAPTTEPAKDTRMSLEPSPPKPTTKPYAEVRERVRNKLIDEATDRRMAQIQERINSTVAADWATYHAAAGAATRPTTAPASTVGVPYDSVDYLQKLAAQIQTAYGVLPAIQSIADHWQTAEDLAKIPGIGQATIAGATRPITASIYLMGYSAPFLPAESRSETGVLQVMEPSKAFVDAANTVYIARVAAAEPSHKPETLKEVETQVSADVIAKAAYDLAKADAQKLLDQARKEGLKTATGGKATLTIGPLTSQPGQPIIGLTVSAPQMTNFLSQAFELLTTPTSRPSGKAVRLIELQPEGRLLVAELSDVQAMWNDRSRSMMDAQVAMMLRGELGNRFSNDWFNYDSVATRLNYVPDPSNKDQDSPPAQSEPMMPIF